MNRVRVDAAHAAVERDCAEHFQPRIHPIERIGKRRRVVVVRFERKAAHLRFIGAARNLKRVHSALTAAVRRGVNMQIIAAAQYLFYLTVHILGVHIAVVSFGLALANGGYSAVDRQRRIRQRLR